MEKQTYYVVDNEDYDYIRVFDEDEKDKALASLKDGEELHKVTIRDIKCSLLDMRVTISDYYRDSGYDGYEMVEVDVDASIDDERGEFTFYVATSHGEVRGDFNCWVTSANGTGENYEFDAKESLVAKCLDLEDIAEDYMSGILKEEEDVFYPLDYSANYLTVISNKKTGEYHVVERNGEYLNKYASCYQDKYFDSYKTLVSLEEAVKWIEENYGKINQPEPEYVEPSYDY